MTEILFYHLQDKTLEQVLPSLLEKARERGWRVVVQASSEERVDSLDAHLWTYRDDSFLPHATWRVADPDGEPILLMHTGENPNGARVRFLVDHAPFPEDAESYERMVVIFNGDDDAALAKARTTWSDARSRGFLVTYWQIDERGRWQRRE